MTRKTLTNDWLYRVFPFLQWWPQLTREKLRPDLEAGVISAVLILPQSIALATLAGMPPEYGIYTSIFPVIIAAFWGSSWHALSGPNTAVCVLIAFSVAPFANVGNEYYVGYVLALTFMVGVIQLSLGVFKLGTVLDFISHTVISGIILAVGLVMIVSAMSYFLGVLSNLDEPFYIKLYQVINDIPRANLYAVTVGLFTVVPGFFARKYVRRYYLLVAVFSGTLCAFILNLMMGPATTNIDMVGHLSLSLLPFSVPDFDLESMYVIKELITSAFAIAFLGLMQTVVIARSLAAKSGQQVDTNQEILGQGLSNLVAPFLSSFASSGSFNRSAAHYDVGAKTPMAALFASLLLAVIVFTSTWLIAYIPMAAVAGILILVGYSLIDVPAIKNMTRTRQEAVIFFMTFLSALVFGLNTGVFTGLILSLLVYLWYASTPNIMIQSNTARDGRPVNVITIDGNLFFGSVRHVEKALSRLGEADEPGIMLLKTDHITYLDIPGAVMIASEIKKRREKHEDVYIYVTREHILEVLQKSGCLEVLGEDHLIRQGHDHPVKKLLFPKSDKTQINQNIIAQHPKDIEEEDSMEALAKRLRSTRLLGPLSTEQITHLLENQEILTAGTGDIIVKDDEDLKNHLLLLEGQLEAQRTWSVPGENDKSYTWELKPADIDGGFAFLGAVTRLRVRALSDVRYLFINAENLDEMLGWNQQFAKDVENNEELKRRMNLVKQVSIFHEVPLENVKQAFERMKARDVKAGDTIVTQGESGDCYYLIDSGEAEVFRSDPFTDEVSKVATFGPGDAFGEESLLQDAYRNATVTMTTPGRLLFLEKDDFNDLLKPHVVEEVTSDKAYELINNGDAEWIDCRYDLEYEESRIPGASLVSLDRLRWDIHEIDPDKNYIVYCRSGRRSKAGAFLLRERNINAVSMTGGIKDWPYEVDNSPLNL